MYRAKIRDYYEHLSRSYRKVADFVLSNYYEVAFMTAAQLASAVGVDTTTVVRFSQRLGYNGYPEMLQDVRSQVKSEIYAYYRPALLSPDDPAAVFRGRVEQEEQNLAKMLIHNPAERINAMAAMVTSAKRIILVAEGYVVPVAELTSQQLRHRRIEAFSAANDIARLAATLVTMSPDTLVVGTTSTHLGRDVARAMQYARARGCATLGIVGSLQSPINRVSDLVIYAPTDVAGPQPSIVALSAALGALVMLAVRDDETASRRQQEQYEQAYDFLTKPDAEIPEEAE